MGRARVVGFRRGAATGTVGGSGVGTCRTRASASESIQRVTPGCLAPAERWFGVVSTPTVEPTFFHGDLQCETVFAYGPTRDNRSPHWYEFLIAGGAGARMEARGFTVTFVDGGKGDHDLGADGRVTTTLAAAYKVPPGPLLTLSSASVGSVTRVSFSADPNGKAVRTTNQLSIVTSVLAWPAGATNYFLEFTDAPATTNLRQPVFTVPSVVGDQNVVTNMAIETTRYFRLRKY